MFLRSVKKTDILFFVIFSFILSVFFYKIILTQQEKKKNISIQSPLSVSTPTPDGSIHVFKNHFVDQKGNIVILRGASRWSLEFSCGDGHFTSSDFLAMKSWGMNIVRLPFNENYFLHPELCSPNYLTTLTSAVQTAKAAGLFVLLDLHWIHPQEVENKDERGGQFPMPDNQALRVWQTLGKKYAQDPKVFFELMNEPHDITCSVWKNGGRVVAKGDTHWIQQASGTYSTPGLQMLIRVVRQTGAKNLIIQGASAEADLDCVKETPLFDPAQNLAYQSHFYGTDPHTWEGEFKKTITTFPVIAGEFDGGEARSIPAFFETHLQTGYLFWAWGGAPGDILADYSGTPGSIVWKSVHDFMLNASRK